MKRLDIVETLGIFNNSATFLHKHGYGCNQLII